jgi:hypothetical protein
MIADFLHAGDLVTTPSGLVVRPKFERGPSVIPITSNDLRKK